MRQDTKLRERRHTASLYAMASVALLASSAAWSAEPAASSDAGLLKFQHVRVVNAPIADNKTTGSQAGLRAYIDPDTGALRQPTAEEMQAAGAETPAAQPLRKRAAAQRSFTMQGGGVAVELDESNMENIVVVRQADGSFKEICVTGAHKAAEVMKTGATTKVAHQHQESRNDR